MAATCIMKQVEERHIASEITKCVWSPKMDLVAIANIQGKKNAYFIFVHATSTQIVTFFRYMSMLKQICP